MGGDRLNSRSGGVGGYDVEARGGGLGDVDGDRLNGRSSGVGGLRGRGGWLGGDLVGGVLKRPGDLEGVLNDRPGRRRGNGG